MQETKGEKGREEDRLILECLPPDLRLINFGHAGNAVFEVQPVEYHVSVASKERDVGFTFSVLLYVSC